MVAILMISFAWGGHLVMPSQVGSTYDSETVPVDFPMCPPNQTAEVTTYHFHSATFALQVLESCGPGGGNLAINVTEPSGAHFADQIHGGALAEPVTVYSPDLEVGLTWDGSTEATLLVEGWLWWYS